MVPLMGGLGVEWYQIACGYEHTAGLTRKGDILAWGGNCSGQLGHGDDVDIGEPKLVTSSLFGKKVVHVACGELYTWYWYVYKILILDASSILRVTSNN